MRTISSRFGAALAFGALLVAGVSCQFVAAVDRDKLPGEGGGGPGGAGGNAEGGGGSAEGGGGTGGSSGACTDMAKNGSETDVDCGGTCAPCANGKTCAIGADCVSGACSATNVCRDRLLISEVRSRGPGGAADDFIEIYNPMDTPASTEGWSVATRDVDVSGAQPPACETLTETVRWTGKGGTEMIPARGHLLIASTGYNATPTADATYPSLTAGFLDAGSVVLMIGTEVADAVCFQYDADTLAALTGCTAAPYTCEGAPAVNPHDDSNQTSTADSLVRNPGGMAGSGTDTGDSTSDFASAPSEAQNLASEPTPP